jgi:hypothetical protein
MRDYVQTFWIRANERNDVYGPGANPGDPLILTGSFTSQSYSVGKDKDEATDRIEQYENTLIGDFTVPDFGGYIWSIDSYQDLDPIYILLDKKHVIDLILRGNIKTEFFVYDLMLQQKTVLGGKSPRKVWHGNEGTKKPDLSPSSIFASLTTDDFGIPAALESLEKELRRQHFEREANIVEYALGRIKDLTWSIFEAIEYLTKNGIL